MDGTGAIEKEREKEVIITHGTVWMSNYVLLMACDTSTVVLNGICLQQIPEAKGIMSSSFLVELVSLA